MKQFEIIQSLLGGWNEISQIGIWSTVYDVEEMFGEGVEIVRGEIEEDEKYLYIYCEELRDRFHKVIIPDAELRFDSESIYLYRIENLWEE